MRNIPAAAALCHVWSRDGTKIACNVAGAILQADGGPSQYTSVWTFQLDGSDPRELFTSDRFAENGGGPIAMSWDRDSNAVVFMVTRPNSPRCETFDCGFSRCAGLRVSTSGNVPPRLLGALSTWEVLPGNTPEGWLLTDGVGPETWTNKRIARVDGQAAVTYLTDPDYASAEPTWSPDLTKIAYVSAIDVGSIVPASDGSAGRDSAAAKQAKGERRIWLMSADGSSKRQLTTDDLYRDERPPWSHDGSQIIFMRLTAERGVYMDGAGDGWVA